VADIIEVWEYNMEEELVKIMHLAEEYNIIAFVSKLFIIRTLNFLESLFNQLNLMKTE
jgi:hypothetical protein